MLICIKLYVIINQIKINEVFILRKIFALLMVLALLCTALTACTSESTNNESNESSTISTTDDVIESSIFENTTSGITMKPVETYTANSYVSGTYSSSILEASKFEFKPIEPVKPNAVDFTIDEFKSNMGENIDTADKSKIDSLDEKTRNELATQKANLVYDLAVAFNSKKINVNINETTGVMSLDSSVLFAGDSAELSKEGKDYLKKFVTAYSSIVFSNEYDGFVSKIMVEGHTAPVSGSTYESGLPLSKERANIVKEYCLSKEAGLSGEQLANLDSTLEAVGLSNSKPIKDSAGKVNMAASRRVTFRFLINIDQ